MLAKNLVSQKSLALPLAIYPYSNKSMIIHWLTKDFGRISTFLGGMKNSKDLIFREFNFFSTSNIYFEENKNLNLYQIKDCEICISRNDFKINWKAMQIASYFTYLFYKISPENATDSKLFDLYEKFIELSLRFSNYSSFIIWSELFLLRDQGNIPEIHKCVLCGNISTDRFASTQGGTICLNCAQQNEIFSFPFNNEDKYIMNDMLHNDDFLKITSLKFNDDQLLNLHSLIGRFMEYTFNLNPKHRKAAITYEFQ